MCITIAMEKLSEIENPGMEIHVVNPYFLIAFSTLFFSVYALLFIISQVAKDLGPGHIVVTCLCDSGQVGPLKTVLCKEYIYVHVLLVF